MAFTVSATPTVFGNKSTRLLKITPDSAEGNVTSGFNVIDFMVVGKIVSMATANPTVAPNVNSTGTAANGTIGISGVSANCDIYCLVFGH